MTQTAIRRTDQASSVHPQLAEVGGSMITATAAKALAVLRISTGFVFLLAFLDKTFGLHYATSSAKAWINGGHPTQGFLSSVEIGPFQSLFHSIAGTWWADWLFMLGLLGIGLALTFGIGMRFAAAAGALLYVMMWSVVLPPENNPFMDDHLVYALVLVLLALTSAGRTFGLGRRWEQLPVVQRYGFLK